MAINFSSLQQKEDTPFCLLMESIDFSSYFMITLVLLIIFTIFIIFKRKKYKNISNLLRIFYLNLLAVFIWFILITSIELFYYRPPLILWVLFLLLIYPFIIFLFNKKRFKQNKIFLVIFSFLIILLSFLNNKYQDDCNTFWKVIVGKPIIYFYPEKELEINVNLEVKWKIIADYPEYDNEIKGWNIKAYPDGKVIESWKEYSYLFWEAENYNTEWDLSKWFIVEWKDAREFLQEKLSYLWLTPKEYNEFIVYWYPLMMNNKYNLVYFAWDDYEEFAPLNISPKPDSILRVFTVIKPLEEKIEIEEQVLEKFERKGFSVIEWGWTILE